MVGRWIWHQNGAFSAFFQERLLLVLGRFSFILLSMATRQSQQPNLSLLEQVHGMMPRLHVSWWEISWMVTSVRGSFVLIQVSGWYGIVFTCFFWIMCICGIWVVCITCYFRATCVCLVLFELSLCSLPLKQSHLQKCPRWKSMQVLKQSIINFPVQYSWLSLH